MENLTGAFADASGWIGLLLLVGFSVQTLLVVRLTRRLNVHNRRWREIAQDASGIDLETVLNAHARERKELLVLLDCSQERLERLENRLSIRKSQLAIVHYDAFRDVHGEQSFSLALIDDGGDGAVISSIVGREEGRVYCKGIIEGRSDRALTHEERCAIEGARNGRRPVGL